MSKTENSKTQMKLMDFLDNEKIPYIKIKILFNYKDKRTNEIIKKKPFYIPFRHKKSKTGKYEYVKDDTFDTKWTTWDYEKCQEHNEFIAKDKMGLNALNINLTNSKYMIIDIDSENPEQVKQYLEEYQDVMKTKSTGRKLPHLWRLKHEEDFNTTKTKYKEELDLIYTNTFEFIDSKFENYTEDIPIFEDFPKVAKKTTKPKFKVKSVKPVKPEVINIVDSGNEDDQEPNKNEELLNLIPNNTGFIPYDEWLKICFSLKNDNPNNYEICKKWSMQSDRHTDEHFNHIWDYSEEGNSLGTLHYYAKLYNEFEYRKLMIKSGINITDDALAKTYINLQYNNVVFSNDEVYLYKKNWVKDHKKHLQLKKNIRVVLQEYYLKIHIDLSNKMIELINDEEQVKLMKQKLKSVSMIIDKCSSKSAIDNIKDFIIQDLSALNRNIIFDLGQEQIYNLQFKNGVYEMNNKKFRERTQNDYVTQFLDWDYNPEVDKEKLKEVELIYNKLQPDKEQRKFSLEWLAYNLTGSTGKQKFKMNIGYSAGNGKSTEFKIHDRVFDIYSKKLDNITFNLKNDKRHKQIIHLLKNPIRFAYCEELQQSKLDVNFIKDFVDGSKITCEIMYGTSQSASIQSKLNTCSNADFNIDLDKGILRRGLVQFYESKFRDEYKEDNYENNTYKLIEDMEDIFLQEEYKNAYLHLLLNHYDKDFKAPAKNKDAFKEIANEYDEYGTILTDDFIITDDKKDCISKELLHSYFKDKLNKKSMSWRFFLTQMKNKDIKYNKSRMIAGERGQFEGIKFNLPNSTIIYENDKTPELDLTGENDF
tara:strand:+ start:9308 stop:11755 length:2448 start_codon:yes stop_codon:yes gene_type:complete